MARHGLAVFADCDGMKTCFCVWIALLRAVPSTFVWWEKPAGAVIRRAVNILNIGLELNIDALHRHPMRTRGSGPALGRSGGPAVCRRFSARG